MESIIKNLQLVRQKSPLVHNITNFVVMNNTANAILAIGASPIMAHAHPEVEDLIDLVGASVINIGTLDEYWVDSMMLAAKKANSIGKPWILDPVGAGASKYRNDTLAELLHHKPTVIRGNASEIMSLAKIDIASKGVDSANTSDEAVEAGKNLSNSTGAVVCISGEKDYVIQGDRVSMIENGHELMGQITGMGCTASALIGAFAAVIDDPFDATVSAMAVLGMAGQMASEMASGPGTMQLYIYDCLHQMGDTDITNLAKISML
ncbi:hydroxyethylthiazole kinase [Litoribacter ruber]|uniref:Hydroxyethylthiazole kinase n=1 Tax=Litoribacter ruber TaxID=702568 RepID=A0AAP2G3D0_9BACT|nr:MULTISPECIES: hydroxyethylthiazole kinase [Litoribacter]MBS9523355.1 hydroxyethylthiazole kinase [Litoribacter alkaliphilus]MBT0812519.1 hydroxyethylthiazole kinase [Litoribacter ruber]